MAKNGDSLLKASDSVLLLVDIQEKFRPVVPGMEDVIRRAQALVRGAVRLGIPVMATEQYPKALGPTAPELRQWLPESQEYFPKMCFSALGCAPLREGLNAGKRRQVVMTGIETHVCVMQTGLELLAADYSVYVVTDAVSSRKGADRDAGLARLERHGAEMVTTEMVVFEWLRAAGTPEFKELQALIK
ncbi:MAG: isochorismatase protein [Fibrobacteres bacterium]|nr:isochorismatase protein [Fibrobacterota bacterium]